MTQLKPPPPHNGIGHYKSDTHPFLGLIAAICCGNQDERDRFTRTDKYYEFCKIDYGLSDAQARLVVDAAKNQLVRGWVCPPTDDQLREVVKELKSTLEGKSKQVPPVVPEIPLDPRLEIDFPITAQLYHYYITGAGNAPPADWDRQIMKEFECPGKSSVW